MSRETSDPAARFLRSCDLKESMSETETSSDRADGVFETETVVLLSNALEPPPDEGIRKCAQELAVALAAKGTRIYSVGRDASFAARKLLMSPRLLRELRNDRVRVVMYVPTQSATVGSLLRSAVLRSLAGAKVVMLALQPRDLGKTGRRFARYVRSDIVLLTPSPSMLREAERCGLRAAYVQLGADLDRFQPVPHERKRELRRKYRLPAEKQIVLHVGHARSLRGLNWIMGLTDDVVRLVVIGKSLGFDPHILEELRASGIRVFEDYLPDIHEIYQLADVYAFPVRDEQSAIAAPLSVLEAMACNLPVVTTPFGALPRMFSDGAGLFYADDEQHFRAAIAASLQMPRADVRTREQVLGYSWLASAEAILQSAIDLCRRT